MEIDISHYLDNEEKYFAIIEQGKKLGIYTWLIFSDNIIPLLSLAKKYQDCAFIYFCEKKCIDDELINEADSLNNVMFAVRYNENMSNTVIKLRERQMLYSVYVPYTDENAEEIMSDDFYEGVQEVHPTFAALLPLKESTNTCRKQVHDFISACRSEQKMQTILWDVYSDGKFIDSVISDVACFAAFNKAGNFVSIDTDMENKEINIFERTLKDVFKTIFPKTE